VVDLAPVPQASLFLQGLPFRHDWEAVLTPVVDDLVAAGGWDAGPLQEGRLRQGAGWAERFSRSTRATLHFRGEPYGVAGDSRYDLYQEVLRYRLGDEVADITATWPPEPETLP
jgi:hypothetical protein